MKKKLIRLMKKTGMVERSLRILMRIFTLFPVRKNRVMFESFLGKQYNDSPKAIHDELKKRDASLELIISKQRGVSITDEHVTSVDRMTIKWIFLLATSRVWISNSRLPSWLVKRKGTLYYQTWHGTPLKKLALDMVDVRMANTSTNRYKKDFVKESAKWDVLLSPNSYSSNIFKRAFGYKGRMLEIGYPRNDVLYQSEHHLHFIDKVKAHYQIASGKKIILYAPTWRDDDYAEQGNYSFKLPFSIERFEEEFGEEYTMLVRLHYLVGDQLDLSTVSTIKNASRYPEISELYLAADILITDYSSVMFDYAHLKRPMLFYTYDLKHYRDHLRGFYFSFEDEAPGPLIQEEQTLFEEIRQIESWERRFDLKSEAFRRHYCEWDDGHAAKRAALDILENIK